MDGTGLRGCPAGRTPEGLWLAGVRQDTVLIVAPDTAAQSAQVSGGKKIFKQTWCPVEDTDLPPRMARNVPTSEIRGSKHFHTRIVFNTSTEFCSLTSYFLELNNGSRALWIAFRTSSASVDPCPSAVHVQIGRCVSADMN